MTLKVSMVVTTSTRASAGAAAEVTSAAIAKVSDLMARLSEGMRGVRADRGLELQDEGVVGEVGVGGVVLVAVGEAHAGELAGEEGQRRRGEPHLAELLHLRD